MMHRYSEFSRSESAHKVRCTLCPAQCVLAPGKRGICGTRANSDGRLEILTWGRFASVAVDPIEKKPFSHFLPGTRTFSLGTEGCNLVCPFCQNASLSQCTRMPGYSPDPIRQWTPEEVIHEAINSHCASIAFTYSEPVLATEFALEVATLAREHLLRLVFVTNGQINRDPLLGLCEHLDAANIDLKSFSQDVYRTQLKGRLSATLDAIVLMHDRGVWVEVTTLVVPGMNDSASELTEIAQFIAGVSPDIPWHVSRFHPAFKETTRPPTDGKMILSALEIGAAAGLRYVYAGNMPTGQGEKTCCPNCRNVVVERTGYRVNRINTEQSRCPRCGWNIAGVGFP